MEFGEGVMEGLRLIDMDQNVTIRTQRGRGKQVRNPFESPSFKEENRISLDATYMFDASGPGSIRRSDVGLVGLAMANIDIQEFTAGFRTMRDITSADDFWHNPALVHAALRHSTRRRGLQTGHVRID